MTPRGPVATWFRRILGGLLIVLCIGVLITRASVLFANNPVYPITVIFGVVVGVLLIVRAPHPRRRFSGAAGTIAAVLL